MIENNYSMRILSCLIICISLFSACENEVDLTADFRNIPIVYGLLNHGDSINYIRIQKAYLPADGESALDVALNPDSLFYFRLAYLSRHHNFTFLLPSLLIKILLQAIEAK